MGESESRAPEPRKEPSRRAVTKGVAWGVPVVLMAAPAALAAGSLHPTGPYQSQQIKSGKSAGLWLDVKINTGAIVPSGTVVTVTAVSGAGYSLDGGPYTGTITNGTFAVVSVPLSPDVLIPSGTTLYFTVIILGVTYTVPVFVP